MEEILVHNQKEFDVAIQKKDCWIIIKDTTQIIEVTKPDDNSTVTAYDNSTVRAYDNSTVTAYDNSTVRAYGNSTVRAYGNSTVRAYGNSTVRAYDNSTVTACGNSTVTACGNSTVTACGNSTVTACDNSTVTACGNSTVRAYGNSTVTACDNSTVTAYDNSTVTAYDNSTVRAYDNSTVRAFYSTVVIEAALMFAVIIMVGCVCKIKKRAKTASIIKNKMATYTKANFLQLYKPDKKGNVTLYKSVNPETGCDFYTGKIKYEGTVKPEKWNPDKNIQCGDGLHLSPLPEMALLYNDGKILKCKVHKNDFVVFAKDITKVRCKKVTVIGEVTP